MLVRDARSLPFVAVGPQAASHNMAYTAPPQFASTTPWPAAPATPVQTHAASVKLWGAHVDAALPWLRKHDAGVRALPSLDRPDALVGVGVLVEPRDHADTEFVLRNWAHFRARQGWGLIIVHGGKNEAYMRDVTKGWPNVGWVHCGKDDLPALEYQRLLTDPAFWTRFLPYKRIVIFQTDTAQLSDAPLTQFLEYDYVGAPWCNTCFVCGALLLPSRRRCCGHMIDHKALLHIAPNLVGNGGLSIRNPQAMAAACAKYRLATTADSDGQCREVIPDATNEDVFLCVALTRMGARIAPRQVAAQFAVEEVAPLVLTPDAPAASGIHKPWGYLAPDVMQCILAAVHYVDDTDGSVFHPTLMRLD